MRSRTTGARRAVAASFLAVVLATGAIGCGGSAPQPPHTAVRQYSPIAADGSLRPGLRVRHSYADGQCPNQSNAEGNAYRCFAGSNILDPCFLDLRANASQSVLCVSNPWSHVAEAVTITDAMPTPAPISTRNPWALELADGSHCTLYPGATTTYAGKRQNYGCHGGGGTSDLYGTPVKRPHGRWTISQNTAPPNATPKLNPVEIAVVWT